VSSPVAKVAEIHEMKMDGGVMTMRAVDKLALPPRKTVDLSPSTYHVMLMGLSQPLKEGDSVPLTLVIEDKTGRHDVRVSAPVRALTATK
jgi:copper(I)-binding protein